MSTINKKPFIKSLIESLTADQLKTLSTLVDGGGNRTSILRTLSIKPAGNRTNITVIDKGVKLCNLEANYSLYNGYLIYNDDYCVLISFTDSQKLLMLEISADKHDFATIDEELNVLELRMYLSESEDHITANEIDSGDEAAGHVLAADGEGGTEWMNISEAITEDNVESGDAVKLFGFDSEGNLVKDDMPEGITVDQTVIANSDNAVSGKAVTNHLKEHYVEAIKITDPSTTLGQLSTMLNTINNNGEHVLFDVSALGASMYLCTIFIDTNNSVVRVFDMVANKVSEETYDANKLLTMVIANADMIATRKQINSLQKQVDELGGSKAIEDWDVLGDLIETGASTDLIKAGDTTDINWISTVLGTIASGAQVSCTDENAFINKLGKAEAGQYLFVYNGINWTYEENDIVLNEWGLSVTGTPVTGDVMTIVTTVRTVNYTFTGYDDFTSAENASHNWCLEQTYAPDTKAYDSLEALFNLAQGKTLTAGNYKITANYQNGGTPYTLYFVVPSSVTASDSIIQFAATGTNWTSPYYPTTTRGYKYGTNETVTAQINLSTTEIADAIDISTVDGITIHDSLIQCDLGNNNWDRCNIRAWLNDDSRSGNFVPSYEFDRPAGYNLGRGFLYGMDPRVKKLILTAVNKFTAGYDNVGYTQGQTYEVNDKVFLLSMKEMGFNINTNEGNLTGLYEEYLSDAGYSGLANDAIATRSKYNYAGGTKNNYRWSRSANSGGAHNSRTVTAAGSFDDGGAINGYYFAPAFIIGKASN